MHAVSPAPPAWPDTIPAHVRDTITCGDAFAMLDQLGDNTIDMIYADPEYARIDHYEQLAIHAKRLLKPGKSCLVWCSGIGQYDVHRVMSPHLQFQMPFYYTVIAKAAKLRGFNTFIWTTPCLWFANGHARAYKGVPDTLQVEAPFDDFVMLNNTISTKNPPITDRTHKWNKNPEAYEPWLLALSQEDDIILDPFAGSGSIPVAAKRNRRRWIGFEILADKVPHANERVETMHVPELYTMAQPDFFLTVPEIVAHDANGKLDFGKKRTRRRKQESKPKIPVFG